MGLLEGLTEWTGEGTGCMEAGSPKELGIGYVAAGPESIESMGGGVGWTVVRVLNERGGWETKSGRWGVAILPLGPGLEFTAELLTAELLTGGNCWRRWLLDFGFAGTGPGWDFVISFGTIRTNTSRVPSSMTEPSCWEEPWGSCQMVHLESASWHSVVGSAGMEPQPGCVELSESA